MTDAKISFTEAESSNVLSATTALASDSVVSTKTVMTSLVQTVTTVVEKMKITTNSGATLVMSSLDSIVSSTMSKTTSTTTT